MIQCTIIDSYNANDIHMIYLMRTIPPQGSKGVPHYRVVTQDMGTGKSRIVLETMIVGEAVDKYTSIMNTMSSITSLVDKWFKDNKPKIDKTIDNTIAARSIKRDVYGTDYED